MPVLDVLSSGNLAEAVQHIDYLYVNYESIKASLSKIAVVLREKAEINVNFDLYPILASNLASSKNRAPQQAVEEVVRQA